MPLAVNGWQGSKESVMPVMCNYFTGNFKGNGCAGVFVCSVQFPHLVKNFCLILQRGERERAGE